jgi:hypothetical protein
VRINYILRNLLSEISFRLTCQISQAHSTRDGGISSLLMRGSQLAMYDIVHCRENLLVRNARRSTTNGSLGFLNIRAQKPENERIHKRENWKEETYFFDANFAS